MIINLENKTLEETPTKQEQTCLDVLEELALYREKHKEAFRSKVLEKKEQIQQYQQEIKKAMQKAFQAIC